MLSRSSSRKGATMLSPSRKLRAQPHRVRARCAGEGPSTDSPAGRRLAAYRSRVGQLRKRCAKDLVRAREQERVRTTAAWLPVVDNLERALEHASSDPDQIIEGVRAVYQQALSVLADLGFPGAMTPARSSTRPSTRPSGPLRTRSSSRARWPM